MNIKHLYTLSLYVNTIETQYNTNPRRRKMPSNTTTLTKHKSRKLTLDAEMSHLLEGPVLSWMLLVEVKERETAADAAKCSLMVDLVRLLCSKAFAQQGFFASHKIVCEFQMTLGNS